MNRPILIFAILLLPSCKANRKPGGATVKPVGTVNYYEPFEILNGRVKQVKEMFEDVTSGKPEIVVTDFDKQGNAIQTHESVLRGDSNTIVYNYKYDKIGIRTEVAMMSAELGDDIYQCDEYGRIARKSMRTDMVKNNSMEPLQEKSFYKYDAAGNMIEADLYLETELRFSEKYKYNNRHLLLEKDALSHDANFTDTTTYKYQSFDKNGNWTKRARIIQGNEPFTVTRYITYY
jgi:hypothetical protein